MQLGNRLFPYPVLNNERTLSTFDEESAFELKLTLDKNGEIIKTRDETILKDIYFSLNNKYLMELYKDKKIKCFLIVESPSSIYREKYELFDVPRTIEIKTNDLKGDVSISAYCVAMCDIEEYQSESFDEDYKDYSFDIKKYDIVAADDGIKFVVDRNLDEDNKASSIFTIVKNQDSTNLISHDMNQDKIWIYLPEETHNRYSSLKTQSRWNDIFFSMIAVPVLADCFSEIKANYGSDIDINDVVEQYGWVKSVINSYKKEKNEVLDGETFSSTNSLMLAQIVLNYSGVKGINTFCDLIINGGDDDEQD